MKFSDAVLKNKTDDDTPDEPVPELPIPQIKSALSLAPMKKKMSKMSPVSSGGGGGSY